MNEINHNDQLGNCEKEQMIRARRMRSIEEVLEEAEVLIDAHFFNEFSETKSSVFLKK